MAGGGPRPLRWATGLGAASSSCSYAAIAIAKSLFQKGASAVSALAFQFASTNLVWELGLVLWVLIGWQFTLAEYAGGIVMIALMAATAAALRIPPPRGGRARARARAEAGHVHHTRGYTCPGASGCPPRTRGPTSRTTSAATGDAVEGDHDRLLPRRVHRPARRRLLQLPLHRRRPARAADDRERDRRAGDRGAQLRVLGRQRAAGGRPVVGRHLLRRRDGVHLRRPDRAADRPGLPQVLRHGLRAAHHRADVRDDGRAALVVDLVFGLARPIPEAAPRATTCSGRSSSTTSSSSTCSRWGSSWPCSGSPPAPSRPAPRTATRRLKTGREETKGSDPM